MLLRVKDGLYKGEIRDFAPEAARTLLASGRAENPYADPAPEAPRMHAQTAVPANQRQPRRRSSR